MSGSQSSSGKRSAKSEAGGAQSAVGGRSRALLAPVLLLLLGCLGVVALKHGLVERYGVYNRADSVGSFWTETAFHYRHALMVAEGEGIPSVDLMAQWPEGIDVWRHCTPLMDWALGSLWRAGVGRRLPFHQFVIGSQLIFGTLTVVAVFLGALALWGRPWAALLAALLHGFSLGHVERCAFYLREHFALPFLWLWLALLLAALRSTDSRRCTLLSLGSAACFVLSLATWHVARFEALIVVIALVLSQLPRSGLEALDDPRAASLRRALGILTVVGALAALTLPVLRASAFAVAPPMMLLYGLVASLILLPRVPALHGRAFLPASAALLTACLAAGLLLERALGGYSHVGALVKAKLLMGGRLPEDPQLISFEARSMWSGPFHGPDPSLFLQVAVPGLLVAAFLAAILVPGFLRGRGDRLPIFLLLVVVAGALAFLLASRFHVLFDAPAAMLAAGLVGAVAPRFRRLGHAGLVVLLLLALAGLPWSGPLPLQQPPPEKVRELTDSLRAMTPPDAVIASEYYWGPSILLDADRAVIVQSKWENPTIRGKVEAFHEALMGSLEDLEAFLRSQGATHLVLTSQVALTTSKDSVLYWSGRRELRKDMAAYQLHFARGPLGPFRPLFQGELHRVFALATEGAAGEVPGAEVQGGETPRAESATTGDYWPSWDEAAMGFDQVPGVVVPREAVEHALRIAADPLAWIQLAEWHHRQGRRAEAETLVLRAAEPGLRLSEEAWRARSPRAEEMARLGLAGAEQAARVLAGRGDLPASAVLLERAAALASVLGADAKARELRERALRTRSAVAPR